MAPVARPAGRWTPRHSNFTDNDRIRTTSTHRLWRFHLIVYFILLLPNVVMTVSLVIHFI